MVATPDEILEWNGEDGPKSKHKVKWLSGETFWCWTSEINPTMLAMYEYPIYNLRKLEGGVPTAVQQGRPLLRLRYDFPRRGKQDLFRCPLHCGG